MNILTFDVEEWFHLLDNDSTKTEREWMNYEVRIHENMDRIFSLLSRTDTKATFFCLGWIAERYPEIVRKIVDLGYEIGSHTRMHQLIFEQKPSQFENDLEYSIKTLEDISGQKVKYFRAPGFSITERNKWAFEILHRHGIIIDCSVFPALRSHGGFVSYSSPVPSIIRLNGIEIRELPISYFSLLNTPIIFSGGGYFRLYPYHLIKRWSKQSSYIMSYFHPRDFDSEQPIIESLTFLRKFKSYVGLKGAEFKLERWLTDYNFVDINYANGLIDWSVVPIVKL